MEQTPSLNQTDITKALNQSAAYRALPAQQQAEMAQSLSRVFGYLGEPPARTMAPDFGSLRGNSGGSGRQNPAGQQPDQNNAPAPAAKPQQNLAGATREMLGAIAFPEFAASLIQGTFQAIVDSSIQQMEAYSRLLAETAKTVDQFMDDNISDDMARDHLTSNYGDIFLKDMSSGRPQMTVATDTPSGGQLPSFLKDLGFDSAMDLDQQTVDDVVIPETRRTLAEMRHQSLATMVMMGINRIVVSDGEINAKLVFHVDASQSMSLTFSDYKPTNWTMAGKLGGSNVGASGLLVNTMETNAQSEQNISADVTGEVRVRFKSDYFPLERFADSSAIQLINSHARVAQPLPEGVQQAAPADAGAQTPAVTPPPLPPASPQQTPTKGKLI